MGAIAYYTEISPQHARQANKWKGTKQTSDAPREDAQRSRFGTPPGSLATSHAVTMHCCCRGEALSGPEQSFMACL